jgi:hypothetical protein
MSELEGRAPDSEAVASIVNSQLAIRDAAGLLSEQEHRHLGYQLKLLRDGVLT